MIVILGRLYKTKTNRTFQHYKERFYKAQDIYVVFLEQLPWAQELGNKEQFLNSKYV